MKKQKVSDAVIHRLPRYYRYLDDLYNKGVVRISSNSLGSKMDITASQIRQDLSCFGEFGQQGYGYNVKYLYTEIGKILGLDKGSLAEGKIADVVIIDPNEEYVIDKNTFASKGRNTPFHGRTVRGKVKVTICDGKVVYKDK